jgi:restriction endonuclease S subunit
MGEAEEIGYECGKTDYVQIDANDLQNFLDLIDTDIPEGTIHNTDAGGRAAWVSDDLLKPGRLDPRNYFQKIQTVDVDIDAEKRRLGDVADIIQNRMTPSDHPDEEFVYLEIPEMRDETGIVDRYTTTKGSEINSRKVKFEGGDLIFSRINPLKNRITVVPPYIDEGVTSSEMYIIRPKNGEEVTKCYLYRFLKSEAAMEYIRNHVTGSSSSRHRINKGDLRDMEVPYPSIEQQKQIAEPIRDGFTDLWSAYRKFFDAHEETDVF